MLILIPNSTFGKEKKWMIEDSVKIQGNSKKMLNFLKKQIYSIDSSKFYYNKIFEGTINGYTGIIALIGIKKLPKDIIPELRKGAGEIGLYLILKGQKDIYIIHRSWKGKPYSDKKLPMSRENLKEWIGLFKKISLS